LIISSKTVILGASIAGIGAVYRLENNATVIDGVPVYFENSAER